MRFQRARLAVLLSMVLAGGAHAHSVEPGLWEVRHDMNMPDRPDLAAQMAQAREQLKNMPPEMRGMLEQQMAKMGVSLGDDATLRVCITEDEAKNDFMREGHSDGDCTYSKVTRKGNTWRGHLSCTEPPSKGEFVTTLHSSTHYTTEATLTGQEGRVTMKTDAKRVAADCGALAKTPRQSKK